MSESDESNMPPFIGLARPLSEVSPQKPDWNAACEAMRWLNDIEAMQGGRNGPTIKLRSAIEALQAERDAAVADAARKEREACAKLCDAEIKLIPTHRTRAEGIEARRLAAAIRARGAP